MEYNVYGEVTLKINVEYVEATSEEEAIEKIKEQLIDYYHLESIGEEYLENYRVILNAIEYTE